jgi:2-octaprenyl-6-methoxyphenol hydroxylase
VPDIAIVGGGLVGLCAALALQQPQRRVTVIEAGNFEAPSGAGLASRSIALSTSSVQILRALQLWPRLAPQAAAIRQIHVSARGRWGVTRLRASDYELDALGYVVENRDLTECLYQAVKASEHIELHQQAVFESIDQNAGVNVGYRHQAQSKSMAADLALIADGARSPARAALGIGHRDIDYAQTVVISNVEVDRPLEDTAYERFTTAGPLAMLPLGGKRYACVWTLKADMAEQLCAADDADFIAGLQDCFGYRLGVIERASQRFSLPLRRTRADALKLGSCLLLGNAANALHPVAGQSFNLSLRDIACLYELLCERAPDARASIDLERLGDAYARQRAREHRQVIGYGDGLVNLFSNDLPLLGHARAAGLALLDLLPALKTQAAFSGMGLTFGGNRLLRGRR